MVPHFVRFRPMSTTAVPVPPVLATLIGRLAAAVPGRARATFTELLIGAAVTRGGHVTDAILAVGLSRAWTTYYWLLERGRWSWLAVWRALLGVLEGLFAPPVWHVVIDDTVVERISAGAPGSLIHRNHSAKPNRPRPKGKDPRCCNQRAQSTVRPSRAGSTARQRAGLRSILARTASRLWSRSGSRHVRSRRRGGQSRVP